MAGGLIRAAFPVRTLDAAGREVAADHEAEYTPVKAAEFTARFGETPAERRVTPPKAKTRAGDTD